MGVIGLLVPIGLFVWVLGAVACDASDTRVHAQFMAERDAALFAGDIDGWEQSAHAAALYMGRGE